MSEPTSRWLTVATPWRCRNSIGSSTVTTWHERVALISPSSAASDVVRPEPAGPLTSTMPLRSLHASRIAAGRPIAASAGTRSGIVRSDTTNVPRWVNTATRNRLTPATE